MSNSPSAEFNLPQQPRSQQQQEHQSKPIQNQTHFSELNSNLANLATGVGAGSEAVEFGRVAGDGGMPPASVGSNGINGIGNGNGNGNGAESNSISHMNDSNGASLNSRSNGSILEAQHANSSSSSSTNVNLSNAAASNVHQTDQDNTELSALSKKGKARQLDSELDFDALMMQDEDVPPELLEAELTNINEELIPLNAIVLRMANYGYDTLQNLTETLPSLSSDEKRTKIFHSALEMRKQLIKLLVLSRWSKSAPDLQKARNLVNLICEQHFQTSDAVEALTEARRVLPHSRVRNYDLATAIDVLSTGNYQRLPSSIKDEIVPPKPYTDEEALEIVSELEDALRLRLSCLEILPIQMSNYTISNGRANFLVKGLFEASVTLSGSDDQDRFFLLSLKFDFRITGLGKERFKRAPEKSSRLQILEDGNFFLIPRSPAADRSEEIEKEGNEVEAGKIGEVAGEVRYADKMDLDFDLGGGVQDGDETMLRKDGPLLRLYSFLQDTSLKYQLTILEFQAKQLANLHWGNNLRVSMEANPVTLVIKYWTRNPTPSRKPPASNARAVKASSHSLGSPVAEGTLRISIKEVETQGGTSKTIEDLLGTALLNAAESDSDLGKRMTLAVTWELDGSVAQEVDQDSVGIDSHDLNIESLLTSIISQHSSAAIRAFHKRVISSTLGQSLSSQECAIDEISRQDGSVSSVLRVRLYDGFSVILGITPLSGRLFLKTLQEGSSAGGEEVESEGSSARLVEASERINSNPSTLVEVLQNLRFGGVIEELEQKAGYLGLHCMRRVPLRHEDRVKFFGSAPSALLFIPLAQCPSYFIVPRILPQDIRVSLVCIASVIEPSGQQTGMIQWMSWLDRRRVSGVEHAKRKRGMQDGTGGAMRQDLSIEEISRLHSYSVALVGYLKIEEQLRVRGVSYTQVAPSRSYLPLNSSKGLLSNPAKEVASLVPSLCVLSKGLLGHTSGLSNPNVSIMLRDWWNPTKCHVRISLQLCLRSGVTDRSLTCEDGSKIHFDSTTSILTFSTNSVGDCVHRFLAHWNEISKIALLAREVTLNSCRKRLEPQQGTPSQLEVALRSFDLSSVQFKYAQKLSVLVKRKLFTNQGQVPSSRFVLDFFSEGEEPLKTRRKANPHSLISRSLERVLNSTDDSSGRFWIGFLQLLQQTLPILLEVAPFYEQALEDPECPELEIISATWFRLRLVDRYAIDINLVSGFRVLLSDASHPRFHNHITAGSTRQDKSQSSRSDLHKPIPNFSKVVARIKKDAVQEKGQGNGTEEGGLRNQDGPTSSGGIIDLKTSLLCSAEAEIIRPLLRSLLNRIKAEINNL